MICIPASGEGGIIISEMSWAEDQGGVKEIMDPRIGSDTNQATFYQAISQ